LVGKNPAIDAVTSGRTGDMRLSNSEGIDMLAGYAHVKTANWGVVAQRPTAAALAGLDHLMLHVLRNTLPLALITVAFIWLFSRLIAKPLWNLAESAKDMESQNTTSHIDKIHCWYFESAQLKNAILMGINLMHGTIGKLKSDVKTDPLTGLNNRRELTSTLEAWTREQRIFSVIALDIDHFKRINDTYGHDIGDHVLQTLAQLMREASRADDVLCRVGGEEFLVLLSNTSLHTAAQVAERLRASVENHPIEPVGHITISLGVAHCPQDGVLRADQVLKQADDLLYQAKNKGRNRVEVAGP
jgi:diguanylate cyclase (GGDEF)-like protein